MSPSATDFSSAGKMRGSPEDYPAPMFVKDANGSRSALVVAHPGHELRIHGWLERTRPIVCVLTDGSGGRGKSRLTSTQDVLERAGARCGPIFGRFTDRTLYSALVDREHREFLATTEELARTLVQERIDIIVGDSAEGYNSGHDVCRLLIDAAVERIRATEGARLENRDFPLVAAPETCSAGQQETALWFRLDQTALSRKLEAARGYRELADEVEAALRAHGPQAFSTECLRLIQELWSLPAGPAWYEEYGSQRVKEGVYKKVVRQEEHIVPLRNALRAWAEA